MVSDGKWGVNGVCVTWRDRVGEQSEVQVGGLRMREKMKRVACRIWTCSCSVHPVRILAIMYDRGRVIIFCQTTVSIG